MESGSNYTKFHPFCRGSDWGPLTADNFFTVCFINSILFGLVYLLSIVFSLFRIIKIGRKYQTFNIHYNSKKAVLDLTVHVVILILSFYDASYQTYIRLFDRYNDLPIYAFVLSFVNVLVWILSLATIVLENKCRLRHSWIIITVWVTIFCSLGIKIQSVTRDTSYKRLPHEQAFNYLYLISTCLLGICALVANEEEERGKKISSSYVDQFELELLDGENEMPKEEVEVIDSLLDDDEYVQKLEDNDLESTRKYSLLSSGKKIAPNGNLFSQFFFMWLNPVFKVGYKRALEMSDLLYLSPKDESKRLGDTFESLWSEETKKKSSPSLLKPMLKTFWLDLLISGILKLIQDILVFTGPFFLRKLIQFINDKDQPFWIGVLYAFAIGIASVIQSITLHQYFFLVYRIGMNIKSAIISIVYRKSFKMSHRSKNKYTTGEIVNLQAVDSGKIESCFPYIHMFWSGPFQIIVSIVMLWDVLGPSVLAGLGVLILLIPVNVKITRILSGIQKQLMAKKDSRIKLMNEVLQSIRVLKFFSWESSFSSKVTGLRNEELTVLKKGSYIRAATRILWTGSPLFVSIATFCLYSLLGNNLTAEKAFTALSLFNILRFPISILPMIITSVVDAKVSLTRIDSYLNSEELNDEKEVKENGLIIEDEEYDINDDDDENAIIVKNASFEWDIDQPLLNDLNFKIKKGSLTAIVGAIGQGKSSLISALLGEMPKVKGEVIMKGNIAYCPQQAWIQNTVLRSNITFGKRFDERLYKETVRVCELESDLEILPSGDLTEIGEKGINLSGGQKQRVSLARAYYQNADLYLLDDPFSAVDAHVGKKIFKNLLKKGLKDKTRLLITHQLQYLPHVENIIVLKGGRIIEMGTYDELMRNGKEFSLLIENHITKNEERESNEGEDELRQSIDDIKPDKAEEEKKDKEKSSRIISDEQRDVGGVKFDVYMKYIIAIGGMIVMSIIMFTFFLDSASKIGSDYFLSYWSNDVKEHSTAFYVSIYTALGLLNCLIILGRSIYIVLASLRASISFHKEMLHSVLRSPVSFFDTTPVGRILNRFSKDQDAIDNSLPATLQSAISTLFAVINIVFVIGTVTPWFLICALPLSFLYRAYQQYYLHSSRELQRLTSLSRSPIFALFGETLNGLSTIRAYKKIKPFSNLNDKNIDNNIRSYFLSTTANRWLGIRLEIVGAITVGGASLFAVFGRNSIAAGLAGLSVTYALNLTSQLNWLVRMSTSVENELVSVERCDQYTKLESEAASHIEGAVPDNWPTQGRIKYVDVDFKYRENLPLVLKNLSFEVKSKEKIGVIGRTGAGKSSLMNTLFRISEISNGRIEIDNIIIQDIGLHDLRSRLAIIPQDPTLFGGTLRSNLDPFGESSDSDMWNALEMCSVKDQIIEMQGQLDANIVEGGENLSVGTRQLICLARALLRKPKILILDEATASVDFETDSLIQKTIREQFENSTVLTIAHRINTVLHCDRIMVMEKGSMIEFDTPQNLLNTPTSVFYSLYKQSLQ